MKLKTIGRPFAFTCYGCGEAFNGIDTKKSDCYPDREGPAFKAYYCTSCVKELPVYE